MSSLRDDVVGNRRRLLSAPGCWKRRVTSPLPDPLVDCRNCKEPWRADDIGGVCPLRLRRIFPAARAFT